jgi:hypothetical protein
VVNCSKIGDTSAAAIVCLVKIGKRERERSNDDGMSREKERVKGRRRLGVLATCSFFTSEACILVSQHIFVLVFGGLW